MLKKFVSLAVGTTCLFSMLGVSAATVTTTTTYDTDGIGVSTEVKDVAGGSTLTYLAHDASGVTTGENIVYVDQVVLDDNETSYTFNYVTQYSKIGSTVKVGGRAADATPLTVSTTAPGIVGIPVYLDGSATAVAATYSTTTTSDADNITTGSDSGLVKIAASEFSSVAAITGMTDADGAEVSKSDYFLGNGCIWVKTSVMNATTALNVTTTTVENTTVETVALGHVRGTDTNNADAADKVIAVGYVPGNATEYGIVFSTSNNISGTPTAWDSINNAFDSTDAIAFPALGKGTNEVGTSGMYAVEVVGYDDYFADDAGTIYATAYYKDANGAYVLGAVFSVSTEATGKGNKVTTESSEPEQASLDIEEPVIEDAVIEDVVEEEAVVEDVVEDVVGIVDDVDVEEVIDVDEVDEVVDIEE